MRTSVGAVVLTLIALFAGCERSGIPDSEVVMRVGPHQGALIRLPDEKGLAELITEPDERERRRAEPAAFVVFFLRPDGKSPLDPVPSHVSLVVEQGRKAAQTVELSLDPKTDDHSLHIQAGAVPARAGQRDAKGEH
jgi:hypothetical protein